MTQSSITSASKRRPHWLGQTNFYNLNSACRTVCSAFAFGYGIFLVGSCLRTKDYRDVDVRAMIPDDKFNDLFPEYKPNNPGTYWNLVCTAISEWLQARTGLPIDFQIQRASDANREFPSKENPRNALGMIL
jgi:hypothetical protein